MCLEEKNRTTKRWGRHFLLSHRSTPIIFFQVKHGTEHTQVQEVVFVHRSVWGLRTSPLMAGTTFGCASTGNEAEIGRSIKTIRTESITRLFFRNQKNMPFCYRKKTAKRAWIKICEVESSRWHRLIRLNVYLSQTRISVSIILLPGSKNVFEPETVIRKKFKTFFVHEICVPKIFVHKLTPCSLYWKIVRFHGRLNPNKLISPTTPARVRSGSAARSERRSAESACFRAHVHGQISALDSTARPTHGERGPDGAFVCHSGTL